MQNTWQDILILGLLVLLFGMIHRKRTSPRLLFWIVGWLFVLLHFASLELRPVTSFWQSMQAAVSVLGLVFCGICFILASTISFLSRRRLVWLAIISSLPTVVYVFLVAFDYNRVAPLVLLANLGECAVIWVALCQKKKQDCVGEQPDCRWLRQLDACTYRA